MMNSDTNIVVASLVELPMQINAAIAAAEDHARQAVQHALRAGALLLEAKALLPYGGLEQWIKDNCRVAPRTARAYMRLADKLPGLPPEERQRVAELPLRQAIAAIATPAAGPASYHPEQRFSGDSYRLRDRFLSLARVSNSMSRDMLKKSISSSRLKEMRKRLEEATAEVDRMLEEVSSR